MANIVTIGADPELFLVDRLGNPVPVCGLIGGTKEKPIRMSDALSPQYRLQEDNVMLEFNIPPCKSMAGFTQAIGASMNAINERVQKLGYSLSGLSETVFPHAVLRKNPQAAQFGCSQDFNAHDMGAAYERLNPEQLTTKGGALRFCGGHIHIGYKSEVPPFVAASFADLFIGLRCCGYDTQQERRKYYGQPGRFRPTSYGIEYRTLSNYWLFDNGAMCDISTAAIMLGSFLQDTNVDQIRKIYQGVPWTSVQEAISANNNGLSHSIRYYMNTEYSLEV